MISKNYFRRAALCAASAAAVAATAPASAATFVVDFTTLNNSGVTGNALLDLNAASRMLTVTFNVAGLDPAGGHVAHIHGLFNPGGQPTNSTVPTPAQDTDGDGFIELAEGQVTYGPIIVPLGDIGSSPSGTSNFSMTYDLNDPSVFGGSFGFDDLVPLQLREIVIHGLTVPPGVGAGTSGEVDGSGGFIAVLPVAAGQISPRAVSAVPEPATWAMMILGFGAIGGVLRNRPKVRFGRA